MKLELAKDYFSVEVLVSDMGVRGDMEAEDSVDLMLAFLQILKQPLIIDPISVSPIYVHKMLQKILEVSE